MKLIDVYSMVEAPAVLYRLLEERSEEDDENVNISHRTLPSQAEHMAFFMSRPYAHWDLIEVDGPGLVIGYVSATKRNEIGIFLFHEARGKGYGKQALALFMEKHLPAPAIPSERPGRWVANINPRNVASIALFHGLGFTHLQNTYALEV